MSDLNVKRDAICFKRCILGLKIDYSFWSSSGVNTCILLLNGNISLGWKRDSFKDQLEASVCKHAVVASYRDHHVSQDNTLRRVSKELANQHHSCNWQVLQTMVEFVNKCESWELVISVFLQHANLLNCTEHFILGAANWEATESEIYWVCHNFHYHAGVILVHLCTTHPGQWNN